MTWTWTWLLIGCDEIIWRRVRRDHTGTPSHPQQYSSSSKFFLLLLFTLTFTMSGFKGEDVDSSVHELNADFIIIIIIIISVLGQNPNQQKPHNIHSMKMWQLAFCLSSKATHLMIIWKSKWLPSPESILLDEVGLKGKPFFLFSSHPVLDLSLTQRTDCVSELCIIRTFLAFHWTFTGFPFCTETDQRAAVKKHNLFFLNKRRSRYVLLIT